MEQNRNIALAWFAAFNTHNLEELLSLYAEHAKHYSPRLKIKAPETQGWIQGKDALRTWWQEAFQRLPTLRYEIQKIVSDEESVFMEYIRHVDGEVVTNICEILDIKNNLIVCSRVYLS